MNVEWKNRKFDENVQNLNNIACFEKLSPVYDIIQTLWDS